MKPKLMHGHVQFVSWRGPRHIVADRRQWPDAIAPDSCTTPTAGRVPAVEPARGLGHRTGRSEHIEEGCHTLIARCCPSSGWPSVTRASPRLALAEEERQVGFGCTAQRSPASHVLYERCDPVGLSVTFRYQVRCGGTHG